MKFARAKDRPQFRTHVGNTVIRILAIHLFFLIVIAPLSHATSKTIYVDPAGNDNGGNCGSTKAKACASLAEAQLLVRGYPGSTVLVDGGYYYLPSSPTNPGALSFTSADSGASGLVTTWEANPGTGTPVVSGGIKLNSSIATASHTGNLYQFQFKSTANILPFEYLFYTPPGATEPQRRLRARVQSDSSSSVGYYMSGVGTCSASNWPAAAGTIPTLTPATCNLGTFLRVIATITPGTSGCPSVTDSNGDTKCTDRFQYDPNDTAIASLVNGITGYATNLNGTFSSANEPGPGFGGPNGSSPSGPCVPTTGSQFTEGDIELTLFDAWTVDTMRIACIDTTGHVIYLTNYTKSNPTLYNYLGPTVNHRYVIDNARTAFFTALNNGQTGLWYLDKSTSPWTLDYIANSGENPLSDLIAIPQLGTSFGASGTTDPVGGSLISATNLSYVTFSGLTFEVDNNTPVATNYSTGIGGGFNSDDNGESNVPQVIDCESCQFVTFNGITVRHTSGTGIRVATAPSPISCTPTSPCVTIENSKFYDIGDDGIHIGHVPNGSDTSTTAVQNILVTNNYVQGFSRVFPDGEGIAQGNGFNTTYSYNDIADGYHAGLSVCENACPPIAVNGNSVVSSFNHIRDINQGITADGGTLYYHLGGGNGSALNGLISNNFVHDNTDSSIIDNPLYGSYPTHGSGYGGHGIYLDNQTADVNVEYNVVYNVSGSTAWMTGGPAQVSGWAPNKFTGNIFAYGRLNMFAEQQPWPNLNSCPSPSALSPLVKLASNIFYFDLNETSNSSNSLGFYVQGGCAYSCSAGASANYNNFQDYTDNLYWRTDGNFASDPDQFHVYKSTFSPPSSCQGPASTTAIANQWTFIPFHNSTNSNDSWQAGTYPTLPLNVTEDAQGLISQPTFYSSIGSCTSRAGAYCLAANPTGMTGFSYTQTNSTVTSAGSTLTAPATVPATFPTYIYSVAGSF